MSVEREGSLTRFTCDGGGCRKNYEGMDGFVSAWQEARCHGWANMEYRGVWTHYCKMHAGELGDD